jgi:hypothetical protein
MGALCSKPTQNNVEPTEQQRRSISAINKYPSNTPRDGDLLFSKSDDDTAKKQIESAQSKGENGSKTSADDINHKDQAKVAVENGKGNKENEKPVNK